ncbi:response regulator transcription factor [Novosphingobium sp. HII-3]|uniref:response regulator transcription factor n=1 Tax=Novosphingobium sp. HII-3 TaxID=2075565 RepID=UPI001E30286E|nr:helix-turn-helix transcriptional regulator [Novosphingobium sp. HII-3]
MLSEQKAAEMLGQLTAKQIEVLELLSRHLITKEIARELNIAPNTVDQRIAAVREKWGTANRKDTVRKYAELQAICGKTTYGPDAVDGHPGSVEREAEALEASQPPSDSVIETVGGSQEILNQGERPFGLQALDEKLGKLGRVGLVLMFALLIAITLAAVLVGAEALGRLL